MKSNSQTQNRLKHSENDGSSTLPRNFLPKFRFKVGVNLLSTYMFQRANLIGNFGECIPYVKYMKIVKIRV